MRREETVKTSSLGLTAVLLLQFNIPDKQEQLSFRELPSSIWIVLFCFTGIDADGSTQRNSATHLAEVTYPESTSSKQRQNTGLVQDLRPPPSSSERPRFTRRLCVWPPVLPAGCRAESCATWRCSGPAERTRVRACACVSAGTSILGRSCSCAETLRGNVRQRAKPQIWTRRGERRSVQVLLERPRRHRTVGRDRFGVGQLSVYVDGWRVMCLLSSWPLQKSTVIWSDIL